MSTNYPAGFTQDDHNARFDATPSREQLDMERDEEKVQEAARPGERTLPRHRGDGKAGERCCSDGYGNGDGLHGRLDEGIAELLGEGELDDTRNRFGSSVGWT
jgi:hypothetical protein